MENMYLNPKESFVQKIIQFYETTKYRHGNILLGNSFTGKSTLLKILTQVYK